MFHSIGRAPPILESNLRLNIIIALGNAAKIAGKGGPIKREMPGDIFHLEFLLVLSQVWLGEWERERVLNVIPGRHVYTVAINKIDWPHMLRQGLWRGKGIAAREKWLKTILQEECVHLTDPLDNSHAKLSTRLFIKITISRAGLIKVFEWIGYWQIY